MLVVKQTGKDCALTGQRGKEAKYIILVDPREFENHMFEGKRAQALYIRVTITRTSEYLDTCLGRTLVKTPNRSCKRPF